MLKLEAKKVVPVTRKLDRVSVISFQVYRLGNTFAEYITELSPGRCSTSSPNWATKCWVRAWGILYIALICCSNLRDDWGWADLRMDDGQGGIGRCTTRGSHMNSHFRSLILQECVDSAQIQLATFVRTMGKTRWFDMVTSRVGSGENDKSYKFAVVPLLPSDYFPSHSTEHHVPASHLLPGL